MLKIIIGNNRLILSCVFSIKDLVKKLVLCRKNCDVANNQFLKTYKFLMVVLVGSVNRARNNNVRWLKKNVMD